MKMAHTMIRVRDLDAALTFYTEFIGLRELRRKSIGDEATLVFLSDAAETYAIELTCNHDGRDYAPGDQFGHLAFTATDLEAVVTEVERRGWWYRRSQPGAPAKYIFVHDPDGYDVEILEEP